jgi:CarD family transcriptional regulator
MFLLVLGKTTRIIITAGKRYSRACVRWMKKSRSISPKNITAVNALGRNPKQNHRGNTGMYKINDLIVYGKTGVCKITDITIPKHISFDKDQLYYVLQPLYEDCVIYTPVNTKVFMRPIISAEEADHLIDMIPTIQAEAYYNDRLQELTHHYEAAIKAHNCADLIELAMSIYAKKQIVEQQNRKFGQIDKKFMEQAEELLFGEFSLALGIPKDKVQEYIASRVEAINKERS